MESPDASTNGDAQPAVEQITFRFCRNCSNLLYPEENKHERKLIYKCRTCIYSEDATSMCVHRRQLVQTVGETAGVTQDVGNDPTVGDRLKNSLTAISESLPSESESADMCTCMLCGQELVCEECGDGAEDEDVLMSIDDQEHENKMMMIHSVEELHVDENYGACL